MSDVASNDGQAAIDILAGFLRDVASSVTPDVRHSAARIVLNGLRAALAASGEPLLDRMRLEKAASGGGVGAGILFTDTRLSAEDAALCNQQAWLYFLLDDVEPRSGIHPGGPAITAALALAEQSGRGGKAVSGQQFLNAVVAGIEVQVAIALASAPEMLLERGFAPLSALSPIGAASAACVLDDTPAHEARHAVGMAAMSGIGMWEMGGSSSAGFLTALGVRSGLASWQAAKVGFEAPRGAIDGKFGSFRAYTGKAPEVIREHLQSLGTAWATSDILFQPYSGDTFTQAPLVALKSLRDALDEGIDRPAIEKIIVHVSARTAAGVAHKSARHAKIPDALAFNSDPKSRMAAGWLYDIYSFEQGWDHLIGDAEIEGLRERVEFREDPAIEPISSARVELHFADGRSEQTETVSFPGSAENPMSDQQVEDAFRAAARGKLSDGRCDRIIDAIWGLETDSDMSGLFKEVSAAPDL